MTGRPISRRGVLRAAAAGVAATAGLGAVGTVAADRPLPGDCAELTTGIQPFEEACPNRGRGPYVPAGTQVTVRGSCTTDGGHGMVLFRHSNDRTDLAWASHEFFEPC